MDNSEQLKIAVQAALAGDWEQAHQITQDYSDTTACWIHAVLHKIEGDEYNSNYWYAKFNGKKFADYSDAFEELKAILRTLN